MPPCASGLDGPTRSARPGTASASTSPLFSEHATAVELCLFDSPADEREAHRIPLPERTDQVWHGYLPDVRPGQLYGYRVHGPYEPDAGHRFNPDEGPARSVRQGDRPPAPLGRRDVRLHARTARRRSRPRRPGQRRRARRSPRSSTRRSPGATIAGRGRPGTRRSSTNCTSRASRSCIPACPAPLRGTYVGLASDAAHPAPDAISA